MMNFNNAYNSPYYGVQVPQQLPQPTQCYKIIPISNKNDTNTAIADFNGTPIYFHNQSNNEIYIKQFDIKTGVTTLQEFKRVEQGVNEHQSNVNPFEHDFKSINDKIDGLQRTFDDYIKSQSQIEEEIETKKGSKKS